MLTPKDINLLLWALDSHTDHLLRCKDAAPPERAFEYVEQLVEVLNLESRLKAMEDKETP